MNHIHPNARFTALTALALLLCVTGCRTQQGGLANPFLAPNRVPPPSTRAILPGQATPYYPGDPLPVMQSAAPQTAPAPAASAIAAQPMPSTDTRLTWSSPTQQNAPVASSPAPRSLAIGNEPPLTIPSDSDALRFALPMSTAAPVNAAAATAPTQQQVQPAMVAQAQQQPVVQASYTEPDMSRALANLSAPNAGTSAPTSNTLWQPPRIMQQRMAAVFAQPVNYATTLSAPPLYAAPPTQSLVGAVSNSMGVQMRAVPSAPPAPGDPTPRIRVPGYLETAQPSVDGFRPRSSMK